MRRTVFSSRSQARTLSPRRPRERGEWVPDLRWLALTCPARRLRDYRFIHPHSANGRHGKETLKKIVRLRLIKLSRL
jgi:hypothetical protein